MDTNLPRHNQTIKLPDDRFLGYAEYGAASGAPVLYFHGGNGSRFEAAWFAEAASSKNIRLIAPDRPGFGLSDYQPQRRFLDWPKDVAALADALELEQFAVFGLSGGAPHVAAVAVTMPERLTRAAIVSGAAPPEMPHHFKSMMLPVRVLHYTAKYLPGVHRFILRQTGKVYGDVERMRRLMFSNLPQADVDFLTAKPEALEILAAETKEAHRSGIAGDFQEWRLYVQPWGFNIADIPLDLGLWYGQYDQQAPPDLGHYYVSQLTHSHLHIVPDGGHYSTINNHINEIFDDLLGGDNA